MSAHSLQEDMPTKSAFCRHIAEICRQRRHILPGDDAYSAGNPKEMGYGE